MTTAVEGRSLDLSDLAELAEMLDYTADWLWHGPNEAMTNEELVVELRRWAIRLIHIPSGTMANNC